MDENRAMGLLAFVAIILAVVALIIALMGRATNQSPVAIAGEDIAGVAGEPVPFRGIAGDGEGTVVRYEWDFEGDGVFDYSSPTTGYVDHVYPPNPTLVGQTVNITAVLRVTDNAGAADTDTRVAALRYEPPRLTAQVTRQGAYWIVTLTGASNTIRVNEARFVVKTPLGAVLFASSVNDAGTLRDDRDIDGQFDIWAMPSGAGAITNGTGAAWTGANLFDARNARFVYADESFNRDVDEPDLVAIYADPNDDGTQDVMTGFFFEIWDTPNGNAILLRVALAG